MRKRFVGFVVALMVPMVAMLVPGTSVISPQGVDAKQVSVSIVDLAFSSADITINVGDTVKWTNLGAVPHTVTSTAGGPLDSGQLAPGGTYQFTFSTAGTFSYKCLNHFSMSGTIHVVSSSPTPTKTATPKPNQASITLDKDKSKYNGGVKATLSGFTPARTITVSWPDGSLLLQLKASSAGQATGTFRTPLAPLGDYKVSAKDTSGKSASTSLRVIPRIMLAPSSEGPDGASFRFYLYGFSAGDAVNIRWYAPDGVTFQILKSVTIASNGRASKAVTVPAGSAIGAHKISGNVVGVSRSASTTFTVTRGASKSADIATPTVTPDPTVSPSPTKVATAPATGTPIPVASASPDLEATETATATSKVVATETATPGLTETAAPIVTISDPTDPATPGYENGN